MKYAFICPDGAADRPVEALGGRTPLEAARTPNLDRLAREGRCGLARTIPEGMPAGSDVGQLSLLGYDPRRYFTGGRAPIEAAALGIRLGAEDVAFRLNLVTVEDGRMKDYSGGHITTEQARPIVEAIAKEMGGGDWSFHPGVEYRHIFRWDRWGGATPLPKTTPPHDISGQPAADHLPKGERAGRLLEIMERSKTIVPRFGTKATQAWIWSGGRAPALPSFSERFAGKRGAVTSAVDIVRGLAKLADMTVLPVPGQTALWDTDYASEGRVGTRALLEDGYDLVYVHVEASDEATHTGQLDKKLEALEAIDREIVGPMIAALEKAGEPFRVLVSPDHGTSITTKGHIPDPVPYLLFGDRVPRAGASGYNERAAVENGATEVAGHQLIEMLLSE